MADYNAKKVPELKDLLKERSLPTSGKKEELVARLVESDNKPSAPSASAPVTAVEDEIDWDDDDTKAPEPAVSQPAAAAIAAGGQGPIATPVAVPNQKVDVDPSTTSDLKTTEPPATDAAPTEKDNGPTAAEPEAPKVDFSIGLEKSKADTEAEKRAKRAARFGVTVSEEDQQKAKRAEKFGTETATVVQGLDEALPQGRLKRGREAGDKQGGRDAKKSTPARGSTEQKQNARDTGSRPQKGPQQKKTGSVLDDPVEKAKAEARKAKFAT